jgi:DNA-binding MarR family transcriptional regulator
LQNFSLDNAFYLGTGYRIVLALRRITHAMDSHSRALVNQYNITGPQLLCLYFISRNTPANLSQISKQLSLSGSTVNGIIDRLEAKSLIERQRTSSDRRKVLLQTTPKGQEIVANAHKLLHQAFADRLSMLSESEQAAIAQSLDKVVELMALDTLPDR